MPEERREEGVKNSMQSDPGLAGEGAVELGSAVNKKPSKVGAKG